MSNVTYKWKCLRCGQCCIHTVNNTVFGKMGMFLLPEETKLFNEDIIKPMYGLGKEGKSRPRPQAIYAYQMCASPCPHYNVKHHYCRIYYNRPLVCKQFPLSGSLSGIMLHRECTAIEQLIPKDARIKNNQLKGLDKELKAVRKMNIYFQLVFLANIYRVTSDEAWFYNFDKAEWCQPTKQQLLEALGKYRTKTR